MKASVISASATPSDVESDLMAAIGGGVCVGDSASAAVLLVRRHRAPWVPSLHFEENATEAEAGS
jgi:hypothetical protein